MPDLVVMKFGGTSVADAARIKRAARRIVEKREHGYRVVAVLSARGKTTDELIAMAEEVSDEPDPREMDMLLSTGERISCALCAMAINDLGHRAISLTGSQAGIVTDASHTRARIIDVRADRILEALDEDRIVLVAGFQGVSTSSSDVTTLGRGGSDTTAVALAAAVGAEVCEIYTDVAGVYSADPRIVPNARKLEQVSFEEMLEMAASGAGVLQLRSVEYARNHGVRIHCRSSFEESPGTVVLAEGETAMEQPLITAVTHTTAEAKLTLVGVPDEPGAAARIFEALADANVNVDMIVQNEPSSAGGLAEISFTVPREDLRDARAAIEPLAGGSYADMAADEEMGKVSIVGAGMRSHPGVAAKVFGVLAKEGVNIEMISTSPIKISCVIARDHVERAVQVLHGAFELSGPGTISEEQPFK
ncbi:MAG: aspartate kinase [Solirubrobacteraceae bacterium]